MKLTLLALALIIGQSSVWACLGGFGGSSGCCSGPIGGCGAQPQCAPSGGYGYNAPLAGPALPPPPPPPPPPQPFYPPAGSSGGYVQSPAVPPIGQGSYAYARGKRFIRYRK